MSRAHVTVMKEAAVDALQIKTGQWYIDATFGSGGHTRSVLQAGGRVLAFDFDQDAYERGLENFSPELAAGTLKIVRENFNNLHTVVSELQSKKEIPEIAGILFDFGTSTEQLMSGERGFSFLEDGELDMRMDERLGVKAKDLLALVPERQLAELFQDLGGEHKARVIAKAIKQSPTPISTTSQLATLIEHVAGGRHGKLHPATKVFQALRIAVNSELDNIREALPQALEVLGQGGRIVTIAFHEGEDRLVKHQFAAWEKEHKGTQETKKPVEPSAEEVQSNPRSRSAKMRIFRKS